MPSKAAKRSQQPQQQYKILARPSSSDTVVASQSNPELWQFEIPRHRPRLLPSSSDAITPQSTPELQIENPRKPPSTATSSVVTQAMPVTPTRPASMHILPSRGQHQSESSIPVVKPHPHNQVAPASPSQRPARNTARPASRPKPQTPARSSVTPSRAYAGPTFHASPAASALPMPTFFSKSVPEQKKSSGLKAMMEREGNEESSDQSDESPTLRKTQLDATHAVREKSPLDIFFHTDRKKKAEEATINVPGDEPSVLSPATSSSYLTDSSKSPGLYGTQRPCHTPGSSVGGLFPLDFEDRNWISPISKQRDPLQPMTASAPIRVPANDDQTRSLALKNLLLSPVPQRPATASPHSRVTVSDNHVPQALSSRNLSGPSTPLFHHDSTSNSHGRPSSGFPFFENSPCSSPSNRLSRHQLNPSNLRKQVTTARSTEHDRPPEFPTSTTPHPNESPSLLGRQSCAAALQNSSCRTSKSNVPSQNSVPAIRDPAQMKLMEDYLRRVLQLDTLGSDGAKEVVT